MKPSKPRLNQHEKEIVEAFDRDELVLHDLTPALLARFAEAAENTTRKDCRITIRLSDHDLAGIQRKGGRAGHPVSEPDLGTDSPVRRGATRHAIRQGAARRLDETWPGRPMKADFQFPGCRLPVAGRTPRRCLPGDSLNPRDRVKMAVAGNDGHPSLPRDGGDPCVVDRNRRARLFEFESHGSVGVSHLTVDRRDFNAVDVGQEPVGVASVVP